ncbi:MAG TPA: SH3 domain-containing protein [Kofleriaceae bacterium]
MLRVVFFCVLASLCAASEAGPRRTTEAVTLRKKPGEKAAPVAQLAANTEVTVLAEEGRWLRVRANGVEGYATRTTISGDPAAAAVAPTATWSAARHPGDHEVTELLVEAISPGAMLAAPKPEATVVRDVAKGVRLSVIDVTTPGWIHAHDDQGHDGWIASALVENSASGVVAAGVDLAGVGMSRDDFSRAQVGALAVRTDLGFGYRSLGMDMTSNAEGGLTNYLVDADAIVIVADADAALRLSDRFFVAADARFAFSDSSPGIDYLGPTAPAGKIPFTTVAGDAGIRAGVRVKSAIDLSLRVGGHYDAFLPQNVDNAGRLPREGLLGATIGARVEIAPPHTRIGVTARFDMLAIGSRAQTPGLEDGQSSTAHALWGGLSVRYTLGWISPFVALDFGRATTTWTGMSVREPGVTNASRVDSTQLVQLGISAEL